MVTGVLVDVVVVVIVTVVVAPEPIAIGFRLSAAIIHKTRRYKDSLVVVVGAVMPKSSVQRY